MIINKYRLITISLLSTILLFNSCGVGSSSTTEIVNNNINDLNAKDEPYFKYQWHLNSSNSILNDKNYRVDKHADINILEAWKITQGDGVRVAVIDDGAEPNHEDLKDNIILTYNADNETNTVYDKSSHLSHGNICSGLIASPINGKGTVGVAPKSKLIVIRQNEWSDEKAIRAFEYAKNNGAKVISCSWGTYDVSEILVSELKKIYDAGITVVFASGNEGTSLDIDNVNDESEVEWVIGVGASVENNDVGSYSNYGKNIDIIAPGGDTWESSGILGIDDMGENGQSNQYGLINNNYSFTDGTSFSAPVVAGVVALMYAVNPNITPKQVKDIITKTADKVGSSGDANYDENGFDTKRAYGKINATKAVLEAQRIAL